MSNSQYVMEYAHQEGEETDFFTRNLKDWIFQNLANPTQYVANGESWDTLFGAIMWFIGSLKRAWEQGTRKLILEVDNKEVWMNIHRKENKKLDLSTGQHVQKMLENELEIKVNHVHRKGNRLADCMAKRKQFQWGRIQIFTSVPEEVTW
ncbi:hypothetical protein F3Y22_tig00110963pilonHSYRG00165 [Hibiscus syriacus]|uniref:RNase H type-1 domain-containing protein n=1 Tax=Hibiscus syriacus TaxID=106335 RepID=A0A6A2ZB17_HIBSY|nr:hypothetical protein F3Y22_tig00110963pilonHSYRG00165 [Hibiscus syriacus]